MKDWSGEATKVFKGKVVSHIRYTDADETTNLGWSWSAPVTPSRMPHRRLREHSSDGLFRSSTAVMT